MSDREDAELPTVSDPPRRRPVLVTLLVWLVLGSIAAMAVACFLWPFWAGPGAGGAK